MTTVIDRQEYTFQAEIKQLLHLLSHSLYQSREIAVRELISNASDALDKMRYVTLTDESQHDSGPLEIVIEGREADHQLIIRDTGIGMSHDELVKNLGTIAHSGSVEFLKAMAANNQAQSKSDVSLIGQFGVGFYAAFMIADRVRVRSRNYRDDSGWEWESEGTGSFTVTPVDGPLPRGTEVILHLKEDAKDFTAPWRIKDIIKRFSSFVPHPIRLGEGGEVLNDQKPIWVEPKSQVTEEQYTRFYQHLTHHPEETPLWHLHLAADSPIQFRAIVYCPPTNPERLGYTRSSTACTSAQSGSSSSPSAASLCRIIYDSSTAWSIPRTCRSTFPARRSRITASSVGCAPRSSRASSTAWTTSPRTSPTSSRPSTASSARC